jgi:AraC-like DNA-binding protein
MQNGNILCSIPITTEKPVPSLPRLFHYIHTIADNPSYYSEGKLRPAEAHCVFHYTLRGRGECRYYNKVQSVLPGQGFIQVINDPNVGYYYPKDSNEEWEFVCFCFDGGNSLQIMNELTKKYGCVYSIPKDTPILVELLDESKWQKDSLLSIFDSSRYFYALYLELVNSVSHTFDIYSHKIVLEVKKTVSALICKNPSIEEIASRLGMTREHISRTFHTFTGKKLKTYISEQQLVYACNLLLNTNMTVQEIAVNMSFSSTSNFIRFFKSKMYTTPDKFRKSGTMPYF